MSISAQGPKDAIRTNLVSCWLVIEEERERGESSISCLDWNDIKYGRQSSHLDFRFRHGQSRFLVICWWKRVNLMSLKRYCLLEDPATPTNHKILHNNDWFLNWLVVWCGQSPWPPLLTITWSPGDITYFLLGRAKYSSAFITAWLGIWPFSSFWNFSVIEKETELIVVQIPVDLSVGRCIDLKGWLFIRCLW
jgi:hypothetical protein